MNHNVRIAGKRYGKQADSAELLARLQALDLQLLQWLLRYPFQRIEDLVVATGSSTATVYRHIDVLFDLKLIEAVSSAVLGTASCHLYHLSNTGLTVLAASEKQEAALLSQLWGCDERSLLRLLPRLASLVAVQQCINGLVTFAPRALGQRGYRSEVRWHWVRDYVHRFTYRERELRCKSDAALLLRLHPGKQAGAVQMQREQWYAMFLLLDSVLDEPEQIKRRLKRLLSYRESAERWPVYSDFPPVLILVPTFYRAEHWQRYAAEVAALLSADPLAGAIAHVPDEQDALFGDPWRWSWKSLATGVPCRLQDLIRPQPKEALLPGLLDLPSLEKRLTTEVPSSHRSGRLIRGDFVQRAESMLDATAEEAEAVEARDEQERVALLGLALNRRQQAILEILFAYPFLNACEMAALLDVQRSSIERYLRDLYPAGCIDPVSTHLGKRWRLSERGLTLLAATHHASVRTIAVPISNASSKVEEEGLVQRGLDVLQRHLDHTVGIYGFFSALSLATQQEGNSGEEHRLLWWEVGAGCERRYRDHDHWHNLRPDACGEYQAGEKRMRFWLEWDRGTMGVRDLTAKFATYAHYVASKEWFKEQRVLPCLLVVAADMAQEQRVIRVATTTLAQISGLIVRTTTATRLTDRGPLGAIWYAVLPQGRQLVGGVVQRSPFYLAGG